MRANNLLQFTHQVSIELRFRKALSQERFKSSLEFTVNGTVSQSTNSLAVLTEPRKGDFLSFIYEKRNYVPYVLKAKHRCFTTSLSSDINSGIFTVRDCQKSFL